MKSLSAPGHGNSSLYLPLIRFIRSLILAGLFLIPPVMNGQSSFLWYFGNLGGIRFNPSGSTVPATGSHMNTSEGSTIVSDTAGVIMFYSDGQSVWDNNSATPVFNALPGSQSATQAALALAIPGSECQRFLIFTTKGVEQTGAHDLGIALVNVTGTSPNYSVSVSAPAMSVIQPSGAVWIAEKLAAISDTSGGYWVIAHNFLYGTLTANTFYKYHITAANFSTVTTTAQAQAALMAIQQTQSVGSNHSDDIGYNAQGQMKFSKNGQKLALVLAGSKTIDLFNFNLTTGLLTLLATTNVSGSQGNIYGCELSPQGNMLYTSEGFANSGATIRKLYQWNISAGTLVNPYIVASGGNVTSGRYKYNALQLGPNDKIYCSEESSVSSLSVINNPNIAGAGCGWSSMTVPISGSNTLGLSTVVPNFGCACLPSPGPVSGPSAICRGATGVTYTVAAVPGATGYVWSLPPGVVITSGNNTSTITVTFTPTSVSGLITAHAINPSCVGLNSPSFPVTVNPSPAVALGADTSICQGQTVTFNAGSCVGCSFQWSNLTTGQTNIGSNQTYTTGTAGVYMVAVTNSGGCTGRDTVQLFVSPSFPLTVSIAASSNPVCAGTQVSFTANGQPSGIPGSYAWTINGTVVPEVSVPLLVYAPSAGDCIQCFYSSNITCVTGSPAASNTVCMTVIPNMPVGVSISASENPVCAGSSVTFTAQPLNPGETPLYQWFVNGIPAGTNSTLFSCTPGNGECVTCTLNSGIACAVGNPAQSNPVCMTVNPVLPVGVTITASANPVCSGTLVNFTATPVNGGNAPSFQWQVNTVPVSGATGGSYSYTPADGDMVTCNCTSSEPCPLANPVVSMPVVMSVSQVLPVAVTISASENPICAGSTVIFSAQPLNPGDSPLYQWFVNGIPAGTNSSQFSYAPGNGDCVTCTLNTGNACSSGNPASSNPVCMTVNPVLPVGVTIAASANPVCSGTLVNFTATPVNGGNAPSFQWQVNTVPVSGATGGSYSITPADGDEITCIITSSEVCTLANPVVSLPVVMSVNPLLPVSITITASENPFCAGSVVTFTAVPVNGGSVPGFQWVVNGVVTGPDHWIYTRTPAANELVSCRLTSSEVCASGNPALSNVISMMETPLLPAGISIVASANPICPGTPVTFTATPVNGGSAPVYLWKINGSNTGAAPMASYTFQPSAGDLVTCEMTSNLNCVISNPATSPAILMNEHPVPVVLITPCFDTVTLLTAREYALRGGHPSGGTWSGAGVDPASGLFSPSAAGTGLHPVTYTCSNLHNCIASGSKRIRVIAPAAFSCGEMLTDVRDQSTYTTMMIGNQCWMKENLRYGHPAFYTDPQTDNCLTERYIRLSSTGSAISYYQWDEVMNYTDSAGSRGICPPGWHVPGQAEWEQLLNNFNGPGRAAGWLKDKKATGVFQSCQNGLFYQNRTWAFSDGVYAGSMYWTSTVIDPERAEARGINDFNMSVSRYHSLRNNAFNVRCVKD